MSSPAASGLPNTCCRIWSRRRRPRPRRSPHPHPHPRPRPRPRLSARSSDYRSPITDHEQEHEHEHEADLTNPRTQNHAEGVIRIVGIKKVLSFFLTVLANTP